jgi:hypothetical protein
MTTVANQLLEEALSDKRPINKQRVAKKAAHNRIEVTNISVR